MRNVLLALLILGIIPLSAYADTVYTYTGDYFGTYFGTPRVSGVYSTADRITGSFTVADGFVPGFTTGGAAFTGYGLHQDANGGYGPSTFMDGVLNYSFTDGHQTLTKANSTATIYLGIPIVGLNLENGSCGPCLYAYDLDAWPTGFKPSAWSIDIRTPTSLITTFVLGDRGDQAVLDATNYGLNGQSVGPSDGSRGGTWTAQAVPEPATLLLVVVGIGAVALSKMRNII
jgi:hypothetical protein